MKRVYCLATLILGSAFTSLQAQVPPIINYQGRVVTGGTNFNGTGQFKFALVNTAGSTTFWSNDGTSSGGSQPTAAVSLGVSNGLYAVLLGNTALPNMTAVPHAVFTNTDVRLRVWFNDGVTGSQLLTPDQRLAAVGYAMMAANVPDGVITSNKLADGAVTTVKLAPGAVNSASLGLNSVTSSNLADFIELGATNVTGRLDVYRTTAGTPAVSLIGSSSQISTYGSDGQEQIRLWGSAYGEILLNNNLSNNATAVTLSANGTTGGFLRLNNTNGVQRARLDGANIGGLLTLYQADGATGAVLDGDSSGSGLLNLYNTNGSVRAQLYGQGSGGGGVLSLNNQTGQQVVELLSYSYGGSLTMKDGAGVSSVIIGSSISGGGYSYLYNADGGYGLHLDGDSGGAGAINIFNTNSSMRLNLQGQGTGGGAQINAYAGDGSLGARIYGDSGGGGLMELMDATGSPRLSLDGYGNGNGGQINVYSGDGQTGAILYGDVSGGGDMRLYSTNNSMRLWLDGYGSGGGGQMQVLANDGNYTVNIQGDSGGAGLISVANTNGSTRAFIDGHGTYGGGEISVYDHSGTETVEIVGQQSSTLGSRITMRQSSGVASLTLDGEYGGAGEGSAITLNNGAGSIRLRLEGDQNDAGYVVVYGTNGLANITLNGQSSGQGRITCDILQINGGSDLSEQFDIAGARAPEPGDVVVIDAENPGKLLVSTQPYDHAVAGIVSGAGGVRTGMLMGQSGTPADGKHAVALTGRVYVKADASKGAIRPGDLLTTSSVPGHAMKVTDHSQANGTILGKAMSALPAGRGLVLVLVSLQ